MQMFEVPQDGDYWAAENSGKKLRLGFTFVLYYVVNSIEIDQEFTIQTSPTTACFFIENEDPQFAFLDAIWPTEKIFLEIA